MHRFAILASAILFCAYAVPIKADTVVVNTGLPDGKMATSSQPSSSGQLETETADDFLLTQNATITGGTFVGLVPLGLPPTGILGVTIEFYRIFPQDSAQPANGLVPTRTNSPSDFVFDIRSSSSATLSFTSTVLNSTFTAANSVVNGINPVPNQFTGGEGAVSGEEVRFDFSINPDTLSAGQYFFVPQVQLNNGTFLWLSAPDPIVAPGQPFTPDLQTWIRNTNLDPNWLRVGTDITQQGPFNAAFSLDGTATPEPCTLSLLGAGLLGLVIRKRKG
jgi:PEP-CTERM motif